MLWKAIKLCSASVYLILLFLNITLSQLQSVKVAVVTGANKGIGYEIVKGLCKKYDGHVYLTSRDEKRGKEAVVKLKQLGFNPYYHQLDITDVASIQRFHDYIKKAEGGIDVLINNAGIGYFNDTKTPFATQVDNTININYFGLQKVGRGLFPLLRRNGRVINLSSGFAVLSCISSQKLRAKLTDPTLTMTELDDLMKNYTRLAKQGKHAQEGWPDNESLPYIVSKLGVTLFTSIQQKLFDAESQKRNISINCVHPGYVDTDLTDHLGFLSPQQGASAPLYLALENHGLRGVFLWNDLKVFDWHSN